MTSLLFLVQPDALKTAAGAQLQGAQCDGMAHAISSVVQRRRWAADAVFRSELGHDWLAGLMRRDIR